MRTVGFMDTTMRDAHQSLLATRVSTDELVEIASLVDKVGYTSIEMWGGATYDSCVRFLNEDPWVRLDKLRAEFKNTELQMLLRGQNLLGYRNYADDVVELFVKTLAKHGMDRVRVFDALNDFRNLQKSCEEIKKAGMHLQICISYTVSPVHSTEYFVKLVGDAMKLGADSIGIKDMAGLLTPGVAYDLISKIKKAHDIPVQVHAHFTTGLADMTYMKAVEAGADIIDTSTSALAYGTGQPSAESMWTAFSSMGFMEKPDYPLLKKINDYFMKVRENHAATDAGLKTIKADILDNQIPGGMYSNLINQLKSQGVSDKLSQVLEEVPRVRKDLGYPPLVTPTSQIVGVQSVLNVITGERYKMITKEVEQYIRGFYGRPPAEVSEELKKRILKNGEKPLEVRAADLIEPEIDKAKESIGLLAKTDEDLLTYLLLGETGKKYLMKKYEEDLKVDFKLAKDYSDVTVVYPV